MSNMSKSDTILSVSDLKVSFDGHNVLEDLTLDVKRDDTLAVIGPNGAGKSVFFRAIMGLVPYKGKVVWSKDVEIGYVPQKVFVDSDIPLTVCEFMQIKEGGREKIAKVLDEVGFGKKDSSDNHKGERLLNTRLGALSGGELQRVLIAFAILRKPNVLLFDEPTSGVDVSGEETVYTLIDKLKKKKDLTIVFISHELEVVYKHASNVFCLNKEKVCYGPPKDVIDRENLIKLYGEDVHLYHHKGHHH